MSAGIRSKWLASGSVSSTSSITNVSFFAIGRWYEL